MSGVILVPETGPIASQLKAPANPVIRSSEDHSESVARLVGTPSYELKRRPISCPYWARRMAPSATNTECDTIAVIAGHRTTASDCSSLDNHTVRSQQSQLRPDDWVLITV